jgi:hypothetical protein
MRCADKNGGACKERNSFEKVKTNVDHIFPKEKAMKTVSPALTPMQDQQLGDLDPGGRNVDTVGTFIHNPLKMLKHIKKS